MWRGEKVVASDDIFNCTLDLQDFVINPETDSYYAASTVARNIHRHLDDLLFTRRPNIYPMKDNHVFLFDEAQVLLPLLAHPRGQP